MSAIGLSKNNRFSNNNQHYRQQQQHNKMHSEDVDGIEEADFAVDQAFEGVYFTRYRAPEVHIIQLAL
jgi:hypothetical protein